MTYTFQLLNNNIWAIWLATLDFWKDSVSPSPTYSMYLRLEFFADREKISMALAASIAPDEALWFFYRYVQLSIEHILENPFSIPTRHILYSTY